MGRELPDLSTAAWQQAGEEMARAHVHLEIHAAAGQWGQLAAGIEAWPGDVVRDHLGRSTNTQLLLRLTLQPHVWLKVSAPYRWPDPHKARALVRQVEHHTGGARLLWGSDWPHTQHDTDWNYQRAIDFAQHIWPAPLLEQYDTNLQRLLGPTPSPPLASAFRSSPRGTAPPNR